MIKCVILDFDGVLADSHGVINKLFTDIINDALGLDIEMEDFAKWPGMRFEHRLALLAEKRKIALSKNKIDRIINKGRKQYYLIHYKKIRFYPGVKPLLRSLRKKGIRIAIGSNGSRNTILKILTNLKTKCYFDAVVTYDDVSKGKPDPEMFLKIAERFKLKNSECLVIDDSSEGIIAARSAGMKVIAVLTTLPREELKDATLVCKSIKEINLRKIMNLK